MSDARFVLAAQLSTIHSPADALQTDRVLQALEQALHQVSLDILILGVEEVPELFRTLTSARTRRVEQVFLWYPLLSDYPGLEPAHLILNYKGAPSQGWPVNGSADIRESFRFACPCNPAVLETTINSLEQFLKTYDFDGVFLDKFRFPSPANGFDDVLSCFCQHCRRAATAQGVDLAEVQAILNRPPASWQRSRHPAEFSGAQWLSELLVEQPVLQQFVRFRAGVITQATRAVHDLTQKLGKKLALDTFTPGLAPLVGQDYRALAPFAAWFKPMIYRLAQGPASLRLEIPCLADGLARFLMHEPLDLLGWTQVHVAELRQTDFETIRNREAPLSLVAAETRQAVALAAPVPVYVGVETVSLPEFNLRVAPQQVEEAVQTARHAGAGGVVASWDLLHTPAENLRALNAAAA